MDPQGWREQLRLMSFEDLREMISRKLNDYESTDPEDKTVALFRALSDWAPSEEGRRNVAIDILTCSTDDCLRTVAERYRIGLILPIRAAGGTTPRLSYHPSRPSTDVDDIFKTWLLQPTTCDRRIMHELVLRRDNYRCILTRQCDLISVQDNKTKIEEDDKSVTVLETAHILPLSLVPSPENPQAIERSSMVWQVITAFSGITPSELTGDNINRVENGMSLDPLMHQLFGALSLCLEPTDKANTYRILQRGIKPGLFAMLRLPDTVTFIPRSNIPVPDPRYLALHAACAKVVHESGMAEILDNTPRQLERTSVLSTDGSTAHLLRHALEIIAVPSVSEGST